MISQKEKQCRVEDIANVLFSVKLSLQTLDLLVHESGDIFNSKEKQLLAEVSKMLKQKTSRE